MKTAMAAIIKKDFRGVTDNKHLFASLLIVPLVLTIVLPSTFLVMIHFAPDDPDIQRLLDLLPQSMQTKGLEQGLAELVLNFMLPVFFLIIPIMSASIMAASSFVGEKEKRTLETLLYCPLSVRQIFRAKVLASFLLSMMVSFISFCTMMVVLGLEAGILMGMVLIPSISWLVILLLLAPSISLIAVTLIVRRSAKAQSVEESQQSAVFLVIPVILLVVGQSTGLLLVSAWILLAFGCSSKLVWESLPMRRCCNEPKGISLIAETLLIWLPYQVIKKR